MRKYSMPNFKLHSPWQPKGGQPEAIAELAANFKNGEKEQTLLGVTGSGKTFVMAHLIQELQKPTLIISHNKTLAAQLYSEFKSFFPENAVEYFISYYDFYQPEAYIASRDLYIEKEATINEQIEFLRMAATSSLLTRQDVIVVASVSCIYNVGDPKNYKEMVVSLHKNRLYKREDLLRDLVTIQYERSDYEFERGKFRVRGDTVEIWPAYMQLMIKIELFGDKIEKISLCDAVTAQTLQDMDFAVIMPAKHYVMPKENVLNAIDSISEELQEQLKILNKENKIVEATRLEARTKYDIDMLQEVGYCSGIENYSRHFSNLEANQRPFCLIDYFPEDFLTIVDESHVTIPQIKGMYLGDRARKKSLIENGFRLPSAYDNRPNKLEEWEQIISQILYVSATPAEYEILRSKNKVTELLVRPTGLLDPLVEVRSTENQVEDVLKMVQERSSKNERVLITTLTKSLSEDLAEYLQSKKIKVNYLHCDIETFDRITILKELRQGKYDAIIGINLLREGLDLPEVSLVAILDADRQGFLRSKTSLIQIMGRAARNVNSAVILYADKITPAMKEAMDETARRRKIQLDYNEKHNITPQSIQKEILGSIEYILQEDEKLEEAKKNISHKVNDSKNIYHSLSSEDKNNEMLLPILLQAETLEERIRAIEVEMKRAATDLNFEYAALLRDQMLKLKGMPVPQSPKLGGKRRPKQRSKSQK